LGPGGREASSATWVKYFDMDKLIQWLTAYKYAVLFPLAIVEGPVLAVVVGWLCAAGLMRVGIAYPIIIAGDMVGDSGCYLLGRLNAGGSPGRFGRRLGLSREKIERWHNWFRDNPVKMISLSKITLGVGPAGIFLAGQARIPYARFLPVCVGTSALQYFFYLLAGMLLGHGYLLLTHILNITASLLIALATASLVFLLIRSYLKRL
jgi:membrane-associated protein